MIYKKREKEGLGAEWCGKKGDLSERGTLVGWLHVTRMAAALARATMRRMEAVAVQTKRMTAEKAAVAKAHEDAKQDGLVDKTAGESGNVPEYNCK